MHYLIFRIESKFSRRDIEGEKREERKRVKERKRGGVYKILVEMRSFSNILSRLLQVNSLHAHLSCR